MLNTKLYLTRADIEADKETGIYASCYLGGVRKKIYLPLSVRPSQWDTKAQRFRRNFTGWSEANNLLKKLPDELEATRLRLLAKGEPVTVEDLQSTAARILGGQQPGGTLGLVEHLEAWIEAAKGDKSASTVKAYGTFRGHLLAYAKSRRLRLEFANVDINFYEGFKTYLLRTVKLGNASANNQIKNLKTFLGATFDQGVHEFAHYRKFRKMEADEPEVVYLTAQEKARIAKLPLEHLPRLAVTRDVFLFECETGLRFSDVQALRPDQVGSGHLLVTTKKTAQRLKVPLSPLAQQILSRYTGRADGRALPVKTNQSTNKDLKVIAKLARVDAPTTTTTHKGNERAETTQPKHELVSSHTARRTFVTLALEGGMRPETVMAITGHTDYKMLRRYLKITETVVADEFAQYVERQGAK
jgi:integrase